MAITEELKIEIVAQTKKAIAELKKTEKAEEGLGSTAKKAGKVMMAAFTGTAIILGLKKLAQGLKAASEAAAVQELAVTRLGAALEITDQSSGGALQGMEEYAAALQQVTVVGDEVSLGLLQTAVNMGLSTDQAKTATKQAIALSRAYGIDLNTAMIGVVNTMQGQTSTLTRYIPSLKAANDSTERMAILNEEAGKAWAVATGEVDTAAGALLQYQNTLGDTSELIGQLVNNSLTPWRQELNNIVTAMNEGLTATVNLSTAMAAQKAGTATSADKILLYRQEIDNLNASMAAGSAFGNVNRKEAEARIATLENLISVEQRLQGMQESNAARRDDAAATQKKQAEDAAAAAEKAAKAEADRLAGIKAAQEELAANDARTAELFDQKHKAELQALADRQNAETEAFYAEQDHIKQLAEEDKARHEAQIAMAQERLQNFSDMAGNMGQIFSNLIQAQMAGDDELTDSQKKNIITLFKMQKAANIAQVLIDTASAIARQYSDLPLWAAIPASIVAGAAGAAQIAAISAAQPPVKLASGGIVQPTPGGTAAILGEAGKPEAVIPLDRMGGLGNITVIVNGTVGSQEEVSTWVHEGIERAQQMGKIA